MKSAPINQSHLIRFSSESLAEDSEVNFSADFHESPSPL